MDVTLTAADKWFKYVSEYGLSFAFLAATVGILIYSVLVVVGLLKAYLPKWFESSIQSHERVAKVVEQQRDLLKCIHQNGAATREGAKHFVKAALAGKEFPSTVMVHLQNAQEALDKQDGHDHSDSE
jgi:hypothetical protein